MNIKKQHNKKDRWNIILKQEWHNYHDLFNVGPHQYSLIVEHHTEPWHALVSKAASNHLSKEEQDSICMLAGNNIDEGARLLRDMLSKCEFRTIIDGTIKDPKYRHFVFTIKDIPAYSFAFEHTYASIHRYWRDDILSYKDIAEINEQIF